jgi:hypothetical protein
MSDDLAAELAALRERVAELEARTKPPAQPNFNAGPVGPTTTDLALSRLSLSPEVMAEFASAIPREMARDMINERRAPSAPTNATPKPSATPVWTENKSGWRNAQPLTNPPGIAQADRLMDVQDAKDRAELIEREARRLAKK